MCGEPDLSKGTYEGTEAARIFGSGKKLLLTGCPDGMPIKPKMLKATCAYNRGHFDWHPGQPECHEYIVRKFRNTLVRKQGQA